MSEPEKAIRRRLARIVVSGALVLALPGVAFARAGSAPETTAVEGRGLEPLAAGIAAASQDPSLRPPPARGALPTALADSAATATIRKLVDEAHHPLLRWPRFPDHRDALERFYGRRGYEPVWVDAPDGPSALAAEALDLLLEADALGLDAADYDAHFLMEMAGRPVELTGHRAALFDVGLTVATFRYLSDLRVGRVNPRNLNIGFNIEPRRVDPAARLRDAVESGRLRETFEEVQPRFLQYGLLRDALARYRALAGKESSGGGAAGPLQPLSEPETGAVREGAAYRDLDRLRRLLVAVGDLSPEAAETSARGGAGDRYSGALVEAVERFQARHGLTPDGVIGPRTLEALNVPFARRVRQIELALERLRWLPPLDDRAFIIVNIPAFELWAYGPRPAAKFLEAGPAERMRVVVGKALNKQTPVFMEDLRWLEFRPYWNVPYSITVREILPHARQDPGYLAANGYEIVPAFGNDVSALPHTAENIERLGSGQLHLRQIPGPDNALGLVKFIFPNNANVYLHSTPATQLFARTRRDFSHGCVRVADPMALSEFVLRNDGANWSRERIRAAMHGERPTRVNLRTPIPVVIFYTTALVEPDGTVFFFEDIYGHDVTLEGALAAGYPYPD